MRDRSINQLLLHVLKEQNYQGKIAISTANHRDAEVFQQQGVNILFIPYADAAQEAVNKLLASVEVKQNLNLGVPS
jgi:hypothetical protein